MFVVQDCILKPILRSLNSARVGRLQIGSRMKSCPTMNSELGLTCVGEKIILLPHTIPPQPREAWRRSIEIRSANRWTTGRQSGSQPSPRFERKVGRQTRFDISSPWCANCDTGSMPLSRGDQPRQSRARNPTSDIQIAILKVPLNGDTSFSSTRQTLLEPPSWIGGFGERATNRRTGGTP